MSTGTLTRVLRQIAVAACLALPLAATAADPKSYPTLEAASDALLAALKADSDTALLEVFGDKHKETLIGSDKAAASVVRKQLAAALQTYRLFEEAGPDRRILLLGDQAWPLPIPLVKKGGGWQFATDDGIDEIVNRRIGANERGALEALVAYVDAQKEYASRDRNGDGVLEYAQRVGSSEGKRDGLFWPAADDGELSPFGPAMAAASAYLEGRKAGDPYRGYHFRILKGQGKGAAGGAHGYVINGRMVAGHAMVAYPAEYGDSGVMTFIVNHNGKVFEKDLGKTTAAVASKMTTFDPAGWEVVVQ